MGRCSSSSRTPERGFRLLPKGSGSVSDRDAEGEVERQEREAAGIPKDKGMSNNGPHGSRPLCGRAALRRAAPRPPNFLPPGSTSPASRRRPQGWQGERQEELAPTASASRLAPGEAPPAARLVAHPDASDDPPSNLADAARPIPFGSGLIVAILGRRTPHLIELVNRAGWPAILFVHPWQVYQAPAIRGFASSSASLLEIRYAFPAYAA